jgi:hypothetical protein
MMSLLFNYNATTTYGIPLTGQSLSVVIALEFERKLLFYFYLKLIKNSIQYSVYFWKIYRCCYQSQNGNEFFIITKNLL